MIYLDYFLIVLGGIVLGLMFFGIILTAWDKQAAKVRARQIAKAEALYAARPTQRSFTERASFRVITAGPKRYWEDDKAKVRNLIRDAGGC